jgi:predicted NBD/HSP70 family sugar kinase
MDSKIVGIDIGGGHIGFGLLSRNGNTLALELSWSENLDGNSSPADVVGQIATSLKKHCDDNTVIEAVGIGCPGQSKNGVLVGASNLPTFKNVPLSEMVATKLAAEGLGTTIFVFLLNDADAAMAAEIWGGDSDVYRGVDNAAMITIGTGKDISRASLGYSRHSCTNIHIIDNYW